MTRNSQNSRPAETDPYDVCSNMTFLRCHAPLWIQTPLLEQRYNKETQQTKVPKQGVVISFQ